MFNGFDCHNESDFIPIAMQKRQYASNHGNAEEKEAPGSGAWKGSSTSVSRTWGLGIEVQLPRSKVGFKPFQVVTKSLAKV